MANFVIVILFAMGKNNKIEFGSLADQLKSKLGLAEDYEPVGDDIALQENEEVADNFLSLVESKGDKIIVELEKKGRAGKQVTIVRGFSAQDDELEPLAKHIKIKCGAGGAVKYGEIVIQGDCRNKVVELLRQEGFNAKRGN